ncbi:UNVERIFIED_CONTAM: Anoctamin-7 [Siphonaria sp. JEL0065]|nr:Anoctamin-7 [Siphonaria sp. JEL0065]
MSHKDAELWDKVERWTLEHSSRPADWLPEPPRETTSGSAASMTRSILSDIPSIPTLEITAHPSPQLQRVVFHQEGSSRNTPPGIRPVPLHIETKEEPNLDWAFDAFEKEPYSDAVLQAFFSMDDSDSDSGSELESVDDLDPEIAERTSSVRVAPANTDHNVAITIGNNEPLRPHIRPLSLFSLEDLPRRPPPPKPRKPVSHRWRKHGRPKHATHKTRRHSKLTWDMAVTYSVGELPTGITNNPVEPHDELRTPGQQYSHLLYRDNITHEEYLKLAHIKAAITERAKFIDKLLEMRVIILLQYGKVDCKRKIDNNEEFTNERIMKLLCPFETLCTEAEDIELRKSLKPGVIRLNTGRYPDMDEQLGVNTAVNLAKPPSKPSIRFSHPYLAYKTQSPYEAFLDLFKSPEVDENRHSDHFRVGFLTEFEGGGDNLDHPGPFVRLNFFKPSQRNNLANSLLTRNLISVTKLIRYGILHESYLPNDSNYKTTPLPPLSRFKLHTCVRYHLYQREKLAMYFAWFHFYTKFLWFPTIFGWITLLYGIYEALTQGATYGAGLLFLVDNALTPWFALAVSIWAVLFLEFWQRQSSILSHTWNVYDFERGEQIRPKWRIGHSRVYRVWRKVLTSTVVLFCILLNAAIVAGIIIYRSWAVQTWNIQSADAWASFSASIISLFFILLLSTLFERLAKVLTDYDNYRTETEHQNALILKNFLLAVVNSFASLFYIGIVKSVLSSAYGGNMILGKYSDNCQTFLGIQSCMTELMVTMLVTFVGIIISYHAREVYLPLMKSMRSLRPSPESNTTEHEENKPTFSDEALGYDYINSVIQFGFITLFSCAFPLAPVLALVSNLFEIRVNAYKLLVQYRRPFASRVQGIGLVHGLLGYISSIGVVTNAIVIAFASSSFEKNIVVHFHVDSQLAVRVMFVIAFEHFVGGIRLLVRHFLPSTPQSVRVVMAKRAYRTALQTFGSLLDDVGVPEKTFPVPMRGINAEENVGRRSESGPTSPVVV